MNGKNRISIHPHRRDNRKVHCIDRRGDVDHWNRRNHYLMLSFTPRFVFGSMWTTILLDRTMTMRRNTTSRRLSMNENNVQLSFIHLFLSPHQREWCPSFLSLRLKHHSNPSRLASAERLGNGEGWERRTTRRNDVQILLWVSFPSWYSIDRVHPKGRQSHSKSLDGGESILIIASIISECCFTRATKLMTSDTSTTLVGLLLMSLFTFTSFPFNNSRVHRSVEEREGLHRSIPCAIEEKRQKWISNQSWWRRNFFDMIETVEMKTRRTTFLFPLD